MLEQLVESKDERKENRRREGFLLTTFMATASLFAAALLYSLFSYNLAMGGERLEISNLVAPPVADAPPAPEPVVKPEKQASNETTKSETPVRRENTQRADESPVKAPETISAAPNTQMSRPNIPFKIGPDESNSSVSGGQVISRSTDGGSNPLSVKPAAEKVEVEKEEPPVIKPAAPKVEPSKPRTVSEGVINGKAVNLVKPIYPAAARAVRAYGAVNVQVLIDEEGNVVSAKAASGHALLQDAAVKAARQSKFTPTFLSKQKVKVTGVIVYNFTAP